MSIQLSPAAASFITPPSGNHPKLIKRINKYKLIDKGRFYEKNYLFFWILRGRKGPAQNFCHLFISAFLVNKRSLFPDLNFKLFFKVVYMTHRASILPSFKKTFEL